MCTFYHFMYILYTLLFIIYDISRLRQSSTMYLTCECEPSRSLKVTGNTWLNGGHQSCNIGRKHAFRFIWRLCNLSIRVLHHTVCIADGNYSQLRDYKHTNTEFYERWTKHTWWHCTSNYVGGLQWELLKPSGRLTCCHACEPDVLGVGSWQSSTPHHAMMMWRVAGT